MKQKLLSNFRLRAVMLVAIMCAAFTGTAWADTVTFDATKDVTSNTSAYSSSVETWTASDGSTWKATGHSASKNTNIVIGKGGANYLLTPEVDGKITSVAVTWTGNTSYYLALQTTEGTELEAKSNPSTATEQTFTISSGNYSQLRLVGRRSSGTNNAAATITKVVVTYTPSTPAYTITAARNPDNDTYGTVSLSGSVITASPASGYRYATPAYTVSPAGSATVAQDGNEFTVTATANTTVTINFEAIPTHTVTYSINGNTDTTKDFAEGTVITFPDDPDDINGKTFVGWVTAAIPGTTDVEPSFVDTGDQTMSTNDVTYYAVFATAEESSETKSDALTSSITGITTSSYSDFSNKTVSGGSSAVYAGNCAGSNSYIQLRTSSNTGLVSTTSGGKAKKVTVAWSSTNDRALQVYGSNTAYTALSDIFNDSKKGTLLGTLTYGSSTELTISGNYTYIGIKPDSSKSGASQLSSITIDWETSSITYSAYATTVSSLPVPTITFKNESDEAITSLDITAQDMEEVSVECSAGDVTLTVTSDDDTVAEYDDGYVMAYKYGTATLTATFAGNASYQGTTATLTVNVAKVATTTTVEVDIDDTDVYTATEGGLAAATVEAGGSTVTPASVTWTSSNTAVATINSDGEITLKAAGETTITASYAGTDVYEASEGSYVLTLTSSKPQETSVTVNFNNSLYGTSFTGTNAAGSGSDKRTVSGTVENVGVTVYQGSGTNLYINNTETRIYSAGTVTLTAPTGYDITKIVFANGTAPSNWSVTASVGSLESATWTGSANSVVFTGSGRSDFTTAVVTLAPIVTVTSASYATFASPHPLDFTGKSIKAYIAKADGTTGVTFTQVNKVPANTGVLLYKDGGATESIPVFDGTDADATTGNVFKVGAGAAVASVDGDLHNYILNNVDGVIGFYRAAGQTVATNRAYIQIDESAGVKAFIALPNFDADGIEAVESSELTVDSKAIYNLAGQRVDNSQFIIHNSQLKRGIYIVNGKKVLVK